MAPPKVLASEIKSVDEKVAVNLRYFQSGYECFSKWQRSELKDFSSLVGKMAARNEAQVASSYGHAHIGKPKPLPHKVSPDVKMYSLKVTAKARMHGFFSSGNFYLVWLDREHKILKV